MKDQYSFLKAIDTSSSSPELLNEAEAARRHSRQNVTRQLQALKPPLSKQAARTNGQTPTATDAATNSSSSISNSKTAPSKLKSGNILTNLVRPIKFHSQPQGQQVAATTMRKCHQEKPEAGDLRDRLFSLTGKQHLKSGRSGGAKLLGAPRLSQPPVVAPVAIRAKHLARHHHVPPPPPTSSHHNRITSSGGGGGTTTTVKPNYLPSENSLAHQPTRGQPELGKCYDEIDQIYDYIRGLAPLPANLRKIKSIDFEQIERDRQKLAERQQQQQKQQQVQHHQHRERYVRSIDANSTETSHSTSVASSQPTPAGSVTTKRLAKVRQRDASDQNPVRPPPVGAGAHAGPMPIRVTTRTSESARPSIKRVESLNLGQQRSATEQLAASPNEASSSSRVARTPLALMATGGLTKPSYLISTTQRGQVFRLPRAHSTSTLNKAPALAQTGGRRGSQAIAASKEPVIRENVALARVARERHVQPLTGSLGRSVGRQVPGFESDLVESFVDDDDDDGDEPESDCKQQVALDKKSASSRSQSQESSSTSSGSPVETSSGSEDEAKSGSPQASERLSQKSHSDYDNDSDANTSETTATTETRSSETTTTTNTSNENEDEKLQQVRARARTLKREHQHHHHAGKTSSSMSPFSGGAGSSSTGKRSQRPTTSSSPSSGRPASPADETQPESDGGGGGGGGGDYRGASISHESSSQRRKLTPLYRHRHHNLPLSGPDRPTQREEHIYEQIPAHKTTSSSRVLCADQPIGMTTTTSQSTLTRQAAGAQKPAIKHPVAYAANVAVNRRYQQQVAALFALQQRRDRQFTASQPPLPPPVAPQLCHPGHRRRASASNTQFLPQWRQATPISDHPHPHLHHHQQHLSSVPHRHRLSMGNIHLLTSAIPLASLCSPKGRNVPSPKEEMRAREERHRRRSQTNANSLDDQEAGSTGTTNSTSSYEAAIKNSEPNPLRIDMLAPTTDGASEQRHSAGRRSVGSGSGSRSLSNHLQLHNTTTSGAHHLHQQPQQQHSSSLVKVPKLSKQSHLLQRPLPKPPNHHRSSSLSKQPPAKLASTNRTMTTTTTTRPPVINVFN